MFGKGSLQKRKERKKEEIVWFFICPLVPLVAATIVL
jgi:hypothetical protein